MPNGLKFQRKHRFWGYKLKYLYYCIARRDVLQKKKSFGEYNENKIIYLIKPDYQDGVEGLLSLIHKQVIYIDYAKQKGYIPYVDWKNYMTQYYNGIDNVWEYFFVQPSEITEEEVYSCKNVYLSGWTFNNIIRSDLDQTYYVNDITEFLSEIIMNCKQHAHSFSFTTLHAKYSAKKIYISVSDFGCGFLNTIASDLYCKDEVEAILCGVYKRKESKVYGLYNIIRRVLEYNGKVRIHSNSEQLIFTPKILTSFLKNELLKNDNFKKYNIKRNVPFSGVHIEIELPLERR